MIETHNADMFLIFPTLEEHSVDCVLLDLPYGSTAAEWDSKINLGDLWSGLKRIMKRKQWTALFFCDMRLACELIASNPKEYRYELIWNKERCGNAMLSKARPMIQHEYILIFSKGKTKYSIEGLHEKIETREATYTGGLYSQQKATKSLYNPPLPKSILNIPKHKRGGRHPTEKPVEVYEWLIKYYTREGDLILDPCAGSFNSMRACSNLGRSYIGIEKNPEFYKNIGD